jgi:hypothetical protein
VSRRDVHLSQNPPALHGERPNDPGEPAPDWLFGLLSRGAWRFDACMSTLSSAATDLQVFAAYDDNASYEEDQSVEKAAAFVTACRMLLRRVPKRQSKGGRGGQEMEIDPRVLAEELREAQDWLRRNDSSRSTSGQVAEMDFRNFRD